MSQHASPKQSRSRSARTKVRPRRDFEAMKKRRLKAARMFCSIYYANVFKRQLRSAGH